MGNGFGYRMGAGGMSGYWWLLGLLVLVGVAVLVVVLVRVFRRGANGSGAPRRDGDRSPEVSEARRILDERYARGDLTTEEYHERIEGLGHKV
jgi:putative membrane protein